MEPATVTEPRHEQERPRPSEAPRALTGRAVAGLVAAAVLVQVVVYHDAFAVMPAGDDHLLTAAIHNGAMRGPWWFFTDPPAAPYYRPGKELLMWAFGRLADSPEARAARVRVLHYITFVPLLAAYALWSRHLRASLPFMVASAAVLLLHPCLPATLTSIDGLGGMLVSGLMWLAAYVVAAGRVPVAGAAACVFAAFAVGLIFKEYVFALIPLAAWACALRLGGRRRWRDALVVTAPTVALFVAYLVFRRSLMGDADSGYDVLARSARPLIVNAALAAAGLLFPGDTVWVYFHRSPAVLAGVAAACFGVVAWVAGGVRQAARADALVEPGGRPWSAWGLACWMVVAVGITTFPCVLRADTFAEKYFAPMLLPAALLAGLAAHGWAAASLRGRLMAAAAFAVAVGFATSAVLHKNGLMRVSGQRAEELALRLLEVTPPDARRVAAIYVVEPGRDPVYFSVYVVPDEIVLGDPDGLPFAWWQPNRDLRYDPHRVPSMRDAEALAAALTRTPGGPAVAIWSRQSRQFRPWGTRQ